MANDLFFSRNTRVLVSDGTTSWEIPVLDGFSFSQGTNASEITLNEMSASGGSSSRRGRKMFNDSYAPAEWSFSTYARPFKSTVAASGGWEDTGSDAQVHAVEEALWAGLVGNAAFTASSGATEAAWADNIVNNATTCTIDFEGSNLSTLKTYDIYFIMGIGTPADATHTMYKLQGSVVNSAGIDFDIDGIATINWAGFSSLITEVAASDLPSSPITEAITATNNFIRNRLTTLTVSATASGSVQTAYTLTLTGGSLNFENNITFLTPETLGVINQPIGHVTGTRNIGGSFTCYLSNSSAGSADLFEDLIESTSLVTNDFNLVFDIGGTAVPTMQVTLPNCHLEVPTHSIEDVISIETTFHALGSDLNTADEATIVYKGAVV
tara:strand:- start:1774 stop:2919 length:1146 start_codon:yes stop_codon:yes gene_type:complete